MYNVIDNYGDRIGAFQNGGRGYISEYISVYPKYDIELLQLLKTQQYDKAKLMISLTEDVFQKGGVRSSKILLQAMGHSMGLNRLPSLVCK